MKNNNKKAIVLGSTANMTFAVANVLLGLEMHSPDLDADIIVFHNDFTHNDKKLLNQIRPCEFIDYEFPVPTTQELENSSFGRYSKLAFSRFECFNLLEKYNQVLWIDIDILVQKDISQIFEQSEVDIALYQEIAPLQECFTEPIQNYDMQGSHYNSGVMLVTDRLKDYNRMANWLYEKTIELGKSLRYADQGIINLLLQEFKLNVNKLEKKYNCHPAKEQNYVQNAVLVHPYSPQKFWKWFEKAYHFKEWDNNYKKWTKMGGSEYTGHRYMIGERWLKANIDPDFPNPWRQTRDLFKYIINVCTFGKFF